MNRRSTLTVRLIVTIALVVATILNVLPTVGICQQVTGSKDQPILKTGNDFRKALESPTSLAWQERPLVGGLASLSEANGIAIMLDRRIDPGHRTNFSADNKPLGYLLYKLADQLDLGICFEANTVYIGPRDATDRLTTLLAFQKQKLAKLAPGVRSQLAKSKPLAWQQVTEPKTLIELLVKGANLVPEDTQSIPHDVWDQGRLAAGRLDQHLTILLNGFDMMFVINRDGRSVRLMQIPSTASPEITYTLPRELSAKAKELKQGFLEASYDPRLRRLRLKGDFEQHARVYRALNPPPGDTVNEQEGDRVVYTVTMTEPAGSVLATVARMLDRELVYDMELKELLATKVAIKVANAPVEELLKQALDPLDLKYRLDGQQLKISRK